MWLASQVSSGVAPTLLTKVLNPWDPTGKGPQKDLSFQPEQAGPQEKHCAAFSPVALRLRSERLPTLPCPGADNKVIAFVD